MLETERTERLEGFCREYDCPIVEECEFTGDTRARCSWFLAEGRASGNLEVEPS